MNQNTIQQESPLHARFIRARDLKRVYGMTPRALSMIPGAPQAIRLSSRMVLYSIADLDFYFRRNQGGNVRGTSLAKKISGQKPLDGSSITACNGNTQETSEKVID